MSAIGAYARALAARAGIAQPVASVRHVHLDERPLVLVPLTMAGEANAPLAAMVGTEELHPTLLVVPQPRDRSLRFAFADQLAGILLAHIERCAAAGTEQVKPPRAARQPAAAPGTPPPAPPPPPSGAGPASGVGPAPGGGGGGAPEGLDADWEDAAAAQPAPPVRFLDAPQVLVPNRAGIDFVRLFGRSTRFRSTVGEYAVPERVPVLGRWLTYLGGRAEHPGSSSLVAVTEALTRHWATGQSALEDANLAALMAWIDPPAGLPGAVAARLAEDPGEWPPAGPTTDPQFDNRVLAPAIRAYDAVLAEAAETGAAVDERRRAEAVAVIERALLTQLEPTWRLMWRAVGLLRELPAAASVPRRWERDRSRFTAYYSYLREGDGGLPQARLDGAVAAARRLGALERELAEFEADQAFDDPLVLANYRVTGEAFVGTVLAVERDRRIANEKGTLVTRPWVELETVDPVRLTPETKVVSPARPGQTGVVKAVRPVAAGLVVALELSGGMGRSKVPPPGSVPELGETLSYTSLLLESAFSASLPAPEDTPWTHGGPPSPYEPTESDARERWE